MNPLFKYGIVAAAAAIAWSISRNIDGPIVHFIITGLVAWMAWNFMSKGE